MPKHYSGSGMKRKSGAYKKSTPKSRQKSGAANKMYSRKRKPSTQKRARYTR